MCEGENGRELVMMGWGDRSFLRVLELNTTSSSVVLTAEGSGEPGLEPLDF
jgi:hypothetical protein